MRVDIRVRQLEQPSSLRLFTERRVRFGFSRFGAHVESVTVSFSDTNGPKGGLDVHCRIRLQGPAIGALSVESLAQDPHAAVADALERARRALRRELERRRAGHVGARAPAGAGPRYAAK